MKINRKCLLTFALLVTFFFPFGMQLANDTAAREKPVAPPKHIIIVLCDALRWDYIGMYGGTRCSTPNIDSLAREGILFKNAHTVCPISAPSYAALFTSRFPFEHGLSNNAQHLPEDIPFLPEALHDRGFHTAAFVSNYYCSERFGFDRGVDTFKGFDEAGKHSWTLAKKLLPWLGRWDPSSKPLFLFISYMDLHEPYSLPNAQHWLRIRFDDRVAVKSSCPELEETVRLHLSVSPGTHELTFERILPPLKPWWKPKYDFIINEGSVLLKAGVKIDFPKTATSKKSNETIQAGSSVTDTFPVVAALQNPTGKEISGELVIRISRRYTVEEIRAIYPRSVESLDHEIGRLTDTLRSKNMLDDTLIILLSDHGEGLGDHGVKGHIENLYDSLMHVPLIMRYPPLGKGIIVDDIVSIIDIAPTVTELIHKGPSGSSGRSGQRWPSRFGQSLLAMIQKSGFSGRNWVFAETSPPEASKRLTCLRTTDIKLIVDHTRKRLEFYDLTKDPSESKNLALDSKPEVAKAVSMYCDIFGLSDPFEELSTTEKLNLNELSPEEIEKLKSLGYIK